MMRTILAVTLASSCLIGCAQPEPSPGAAVEDTAASAPSSSPATAPTSSPAAAQPAASPGRPASGAPPPAQRPEAFETGAFAGPPPMKAEPARREVTIPAGTTLSVKVLNALASDTSKVEDAVRGSLAKPVVVSGATALPESTSITGSVIDAKASGRVQGRASLAFRFDRLVVNDETVRIRTAAVAQEAAADTKSDLKKGGIGAGIGAVVGGVVGGGKGAAIGAVAGGAGGVLGTKGGEVDVPAGTVVDVLLQEPITITVPVQ